MPVGRPEPEDDLAEWHDHYFPPRARLPDFSWRQLPGVWPRSAFASPWFWGALTGELMVGLVAAWALGWI